MITMMIIKILKYSMIFALSICSVFLSVAIYIQLGENSRNIMDTVDEETRIVSLENDMISKNLDDLFSDVLYLAYTYQSYDTYFGNEYYKPLEENWQAFLDCKEVYFKLRYIDADGIEKIRINYSADGSYTSELKELENKSDRYYYQDAITLGQNQIYISRLDLNVEDGAVELPIHPVIRLAKTVYDNTGNLEGIIVLSYDAMNFLGDFENISETSLGTVYLLNSDGYWLSNTADEDAVWAFMFADKSDTKFSYIYPDVWQEISAHGEGQVITDTGLFVYQNTTFLTDEVESDTTASIQSAEEDWIIVSVINSDLKAGVVFDNNLKSIAEYTIQKQKLVLFVISGLSIASAVLFTVNREVKKKIRYFEFDPLTHVYNRKSGFDKLEKIHKKVSRKDGQLCVCFIDINGLKRVNDSLGHEYGDDLISSVAEVIKKHIAETDFVIRIGGDEFLIIFVGVDVLQAEAVWKRICREFEQINSGKSKKYRISVSHGIEEFTFDVNEFIDTIINSADEKMYNEKRRLHRT